MGCIAEAAELRYKENIYAQNNKHFHLKTYLGQSIVFPCSQDIKRLLSTLFCLFNFVQNFKCVYLVLQVTQKIRQTTGHRYNKYFLIFSNAHSPPSLECFEDLDKSQRADHFLGFMWGETDPRVAISFNFHPRFSLNPLFHFQIKY